jgi:predicted GH43/DUF377 family glycosyl hydrolase
MGEIEGSIYLILRSDSLSPFLYYLSSKNGTRFKRDETKITLRKKNGSKETISQCEHFRISSLVSPSNTFALTYIRKAKNKPALLVTAHSKDLYNWEITKEQESGNIRTAFYIEKENTPFTLYRDGLFISAENLNQPYNMKRLLFTSRQHSFDDESLTLIGGAATNHGHLIIYDASYRDGTEICLQAGATLIDPHSQRVSWRSDVPLSQVYVEAKAKTLFEPLGAAFKDNIVFVYYKVGDEIVVSSFPSPFGDLTIYLPPHHHVPILKKHHANPILTPHPRNEWESEAVFNPAALYEDGKVHLLYRALGPHGISVLGYASSKDGRTVDERHPHPAYFPRQSFEGSKVDAPSSYGELFSSGGGWGGCEDPKLTRIGSKIYLTYVAFSGWSIPRIAISWIKKSDFLKKEWKWSMPQLMSRPGGEKEIDKSACLLPEKINGKYVVFHRVFPDILIDFVDNLDFGNGKFLKNEFKISPRPGMWDSRKISVGAPPIKTKEGWLVIYHAVDDRDAGKYKVGAMLLDLKDPTKVLHRTNAPILIPDMHYENEGKSGVAYPCGAVIIDRTLYVYYGGGDKVVCVATAPVDELLHHLINENPDPFKLKTKK